MRSKTVNVADAKTRLSGRITRVERGQRIVIARAGKPVAEVWPVRKMKKRSTPLDDPLLRVDEYSYDGPIGPMTNREIDSIAYDV